MMSRLKRSDIARAVKSLEKCMKLCGTLPSDSPGFTRVEPIANHLRQALEDLTNADVCYDSLEFGYYLDGCNEEFEDANLLLNYLIYHSTGEPRKIVLDIHKRLIKISCAIHRHFWSGV
jgi:hypothetical protein